MVSICCLTYNHKNFIRKCIDGFISQKTTFQIEILIHDDASTDGTANIIKEYELKYPDLIKPIYQIENQYSKNMNISAMYQFPRVKGKYIAFCEGDDYWTDQYKLQRQVDFLEKNDTIALSTENGLVQNSIKNTSYLFNNFVKEKYISTMELLENRKFPSSSAVFRTRDLMGILELKETADTIIWVYLSLRGEVHYNPVVSSVYNRGYHGVVESTSKFQWLKITACWDKQIKEILKKSELRKTFEFKIFRKRRYSEYKSVYKEIVFKKNPLLKFCFFAICLVFRPIHSFKSFFRNKKSNN